MNLPDAKYTNSSTPIFDLVAADHNVTPVKVPVVKYNDIPKRVKHRLAKDAEAVLQAAGFGSQPTA